MKQLKRKYGLAVQVLIIVLIIAVIKFFVHKYNLEFIEMNTFISTIVGGAIFLIGFILAGTMADYKESEKLPSEITASLENIYQEFEYSKKIKPEFDLEKNKEVLHEIVATFQADLSKIGKHKESIKATGKLSESMQEMEKLGIPAGYISRIKTEQGNLNKNFLRAFQIKETSFLPGAYAIVEIIAFFVIVFMILLNMENFWQTLVILSIIMYIFIYMVLFIKDIDDPFEEGGYGDVDMFLIKDFKKKVAK